MFLKSDIVLNVHYKTTAKKLQHPNSLCNGKNKFLFTDLYRAFFAISKARNKMLSGSKAVLCCLDIDIE